MVAVDLRDVRTALALVLDAVELEHHSSVLDLDQDCYWALPVRSAFDMSLPSPELTAGQLTDDVAEVRKPACARAW
jgi:hypothetical protein